jgi:hypothetical protein
MNLSKTHRYYMKLLKNQIQAPKYEKLKFSDHNILCEIFTKILTNEETTEKDVENLDIICKKLHGETFQEMIYKLLLSVNGLLIEKLLLEKDVTLEIDGLFDWLKTTRTELQIQKDIDDNNKSLNLRESILFNFCKNRFRYKVVQTTDNISYRQLEELYDIYIEKINGDENQPTSNENIDKLLKTENFNFLDDIPNGDDEFKNIMFTLSIYKYKNKKLEHELLNSKKKSRRKLIGDYSVEIEELYQAENMKKKEFFDFFDNNVTDTNELNEEFNDFLSEFVGNRYVSGYKNYAANPDEYINKLKQNNLFKKIEKDNWESVLKIFKKIRKIRNNRNDLIREKTSKINVQKSGWGRTFLRIFFFLFFGMIIIWITKHFIGLTDWILSNKQFTDYFKGPLPYTPEENGDADILIIPGSAQTATNTGNNDGFINRGPSDRESSVPYFLQDYILNGVPTFRPLYSLFGTTFFDANRIVRNILNGRSIGLQGSVLYFIYKTVLNATALGYHASEFVTAQIMAWCSDDSPEVYDRELEIQTIKTAAGVYLLQIATDGLQIYATLLESVAKTSSLIMGGSLEFLKTAAIYGSIGPGAAIRSIYFTSGLPAIRPSQQQFLLTQQQQQEHYFGELNYIQNNNNSNLVAPYPKYLPQGEPLYLTDSSRQQTYVRKKVLLLQNTESTRKPVPKEKKQTSYNDID